MSIRRDRVSGSRFRLRRLLVGIAIWGAAWSATAAPLSVVSIPPNLVTAVENNFKDVPVLAARDTAMSRLLALAGNGSAARLGFSAPIVGTPRAIDPFPEYWVGIDELRRYLPSQDPSLLLRDQHRWMFPVVVGNLVETSVTIARQGTAFRVAAYGSPALIRAAMQARIAAAAMNQGGQILFPDPRTVYRLVWIAGLHLHFLAATAPSGLYFIPLFDDAAFGLSRTLPVLAKDLFVRLRPAALTLNGKPT